MLETPVYNSYCRMSSIIFMGEVCRLYDLGFLEGGVHESRSPIYILRDMAGRHRGG